MRSPLDVCPATNGAAIIAVNARRNASAKYLYRGFMTADVTPIHAHLSSVSINDNIAAPFR
jgi:hypothetical protein